MSIESFEEILIPCSYNNRLVVELYKKGQLKAKEVNGFAFVEQKSNLQGLKVLMNAKLSDESVIPAGSVAYIKEEVLHTAPWAQKSYECKSIEGKFLIVDLNAVEFIEFIEYVPKEAK